MSPWPSRCTSPVSTCTAPRRISRSASCWCTGRESNLSGPRDELRLLHRHPRRRDLGRRARCRVAGRGRIYIVEPTGESRTTPTLRTRDSPGTRHVLPQPRAAARRRRARGLGTSFPREASRPCEPESSHSGRTERCRSTTELPPVRLTPCGSYSPTPESFFGQSVSLMRGHPRAIRSSSTRTPCGRARRSSRRRSTDSLPA